MNPFRLLYNCMISVYFITVSLTINTLTPIPSVLLTIHHATASEVLSSGEIPHNNWMGVPQ